MILARLPAIRRYEHQICARTALVPTGFMNSSGLDIRITLANQNGNATAGKVRLHVTYVVKNRQNETQIA